jgi:hypothetical protein
VRAESSARALQCQQLPEQRQLSAGRRVYVEERVWDRLFEPRISTQPWTPGTTTTSRRTSAQSEISQWISRVRAGRIESDWQRTSR